MTAAGSVLALASPLLAPRSVALVGASSDPVKPAARPLQYLLRSGWEGNLYPINPNVSAIGGVASWASLSSLPEVPEHVLVMTGAERAIEATQESVELGVGVVSVMADGFAGVTIEAQDRTRRLKAAVAGSHTRLLGPSTLGVAQPSSGLLLTANAAFGDGKIRPGSTMVLSQSGSAIGALLSRGTDMGLGFHSLVSTGGEIDLALGELAMTTVEDDAVSSYVLFLENLAHVDRLRAFALEAARRGKPVLAYKLGRSREAAQLAIGHTGAVAGDDLVATALLDDLGITRIRSLDALLEALPLATTLRRTGAAGRRRPRVAVVSTTGGGGGLAVDCLAVRGADVTPPSADTRARLADAGIDAGDGALIDLTLAGTRYEVMISALSILRTAPEFDAVVAAPGSSARFQPEQAVQPIIDGAGPGHPVAAFVVPSAPAALEKLRAHGVAAFRTPEACADGVIACLTTGEPRDLDAVRSVTGTAKVLDEAASYELVEALGVPVAPHAVIRADHPLDDVPVPWPVVVKVLSSAIPHKSDVGGVRLGLTSKSELQQAVSDIVADVGRARPDVTVERLLVAGMAHGGLAEVLLGYRVDPAAGPVIVLAAGGILAEIHEDRSVRMAPVDRTGALEMISEVKALKVIDGYRGLPRGDVSALADAVSAFSQLAVSDHAVVEAEVNPLIVMPEGRSVIAVDAMVVSVEPS